MTDNTNDPWWLPAGLSRGQIKNNIKLADRNSLYHYRWPIGIELTAIHKAYKERTQDGVRRIRRDGSIGYNGSRYETVYPNEDLADEAIIGINVDMRKARLTSTGVQKDDHCIEVPSKRMRTLEYTKKWCIGMREIFAKHNCFPKHPETVDGGAHIHVGIPYLEFKLEILKDVIMRPYLPWVFGDPDEVHSMDNLIHRKDLVDNFFHKREAMLNNHWYTRKNIENYKSIGHGLMKLLYKKHPHKDAIIGDCFTSKDFGIRLSDFGTIEFRFFEMTETWEEQELQIRFLMAYLEWMWKRFQTKSTDEPLVELNLHDFGYLQKIKADQAKFQFLKMCDAIGVNYSDYQVFVDRNLYPRWYSGRKRH